MKVLNFGSLNLDYVYSVDHMVKPGETLASFGMNTFCGGKGLNQSIALARAGAPVFHAGMVGEEGELLLKVCGESGIKTDYIRTIPGKSGHTIIQVDKEGRTASCCMAVLIGVSPGNMWMRCWRTSNRGDILLLQNEVNLLDYIIDRAYERG